MSSPSEKEMKIALVEDDDSAAGKLLTYLKDLKSELGADASFQVERFSDGQSFLDAFDKSYDLLLIDIILGEGIDGMEVSKEIRKKDPDVLIIFVTNMAQFAVKGYEVNAFDYIVKPVSYSSFSLKLRRAIDTIDRKKGKKITLRNVGGFVVLNTKDIRYIEVYGHTLVFHTADGNEHTMRGSLDKVEKELDDSFAKCNSCYIVNMSYVTKLQDYNVYLGDEALQISRNKRPEFVRKLNLFLNHE